MIKSNKGKDISDELPNWSRNTHAMTVYMDAWAFYTLNDSVNKLMSRVQCFIYQNLGKNSNSTPKLTQNPILRIHRLCFQFSNKIQLK